MSKHKVEISGLNTNNIKVLTNDEMTKLFLAYQNGELYAKDLLVEGNLKLVLSILKKYNNRAENMDDLFQVGVIGLIKAIDNFDLSYNLKLSTYACPLILGEIRRYLRDNNSIRVSRSIKDLAYQVLKCKEEMTNTENKEPTLEEVSKKLNIDYFNVVNAIESLKDPVSMFEPIYNDGGDTIYLADQLEDKSQNNYDLDTKMSVKEAIESLKDREKKILESRYITGKTQVEIAEELAISQAQVSRIEKSAIKNLKKTLK